MSLIFDHFGWEDPSQNHLQEFSKKRSNSTPPRELTTKPSPEVASGVLHPFNMSL